MVPRHERIVARVLGEAFSGVLTSLIGFSEIVMAIWVFSCYKSRLNAIVQMVIIGTMNLLEFFLAPDLLLWGKFNSLFALILISVVYLNEFILKPKQVQ